MLIRGRPIANMLRSRTIGQLPTPRAAADKNTIQNEEEQLAPPLHTLPGMLERATHAVPGSTLQIELATAYQRRVTHDPVIEYTLNDCLVHSAGVEYKGGYLPKTDSRLDRIRISALRDVEHATYCMSPVSHRYFGHWLSDACATALLACERHPSTDVLWDVPPRMARCPTLCAGLQPSHPSPVAHRHPSAEVDAVPGPFARYVEAHALPDNACAHPERLEGSPSKRAVGVLTSRSHRKPAALRKRRRIL